MSSKAADVYWNGSSCATRPGETFEYDLQGHLTKVSRGGAEEERVYYGPGGEILYRQLREKFVFYVGLYATVTASDSPTCVVGGDTAACAPRPGTIDLDSHLLLAGTRIASAKPSRVLYYYRTRLGTVMATSLGGGQPGAKYRYTPYGEVDRVVNETADSASELLYANYLALSGRALGQPGAPLYHMPARSYDSRLKAFLQPDSVDRWRYAYAAGDPVNMADPSGMRALGPGRESWTQAEPTITVLFEGIFYIQVPWHSPLVDRFADTPFRTWVMNEYGPRVYAQMIDLIYARRAEAIEAAEWEERYGKFGTRLQASMGTVTLPAQIVKTGYPRDALDRLAEALAELDVSMPANFIMGLGDSLTFGVTRYYRGWAGSGSVAQVHSKAYFAGEVASFAVGVGRLAYAGAAKTLPRFFPGAVDDLARALAMSAARQELKQGFRLGLPVAPIDLGKYSGEAAAIADAATRTNLALNLAGAAATTGAIVNHASLP